MKKGPLLRRWILVVASLSAGCGGVPSSATPRPRPRVGPDYPNVEAGTPYTPPAGCLISYKETRNTSSRDREPLLPALIDSEESFRAHYSCAEPTGKEVSRASGLDFSKSHIAIFTATALGTRPKLVLVIPEGDKLIGVFSVKHYCGGTPPGPVEVATAMLVPAKNVTIDSHMFYDPDAKPCPPGVP